MSAISGFCEKCSKFRKRYCDGDRNTCRSILFDTIEAQQQEIDRLKATLDDWKYNTKCDADHIAALTADKDEQARKTRQLEEGLRSTLKVLETLNYRGGLGLDIHKWLRDEMQTVNALLGGKENGK